MPFNFDEFEKLAREQGHSDNYISETTLYARVLNEKELPVIFSTVHLAISMNMPSYVIDKLINSYNYTYFNLKKKDSTDFREIMVPNEKLKFVQRWLNFNILQKLPLSDACTGFRPNYSILKNAIVHSESIAIYKVDLLRFFDTITDRRVFGLFKSFGYVDNLAFDLAKLCTSRHKKSYWSSVEQKGHTELEALYKSNPAILPQGAPTSPAIANLIATKMDERFIVDGKKEYRVFGN
jgi:RNA-directed DNA polymerase